MAVSEYEELSADNRSSFSCVLPNSAQSFIQFQYVFPLAAFPLKCIISTQTSYQDPEAVLIEQTQKF